MSSPRIRRLPGASVRNPITPERWSAFMENRRKADSGMWTDGGNWMGVGAQPDAFDRIEAQSTAALVLTWPTDECVQKFRDQSKAIGQRLGYGVAVLGALATRGRSWATGLGVGLGTSWLLGETGGIQVHRGWSFQCDSTVKLELYAHPRARHRDAMTISRTDRLWDHDKKLITHATWSRSSRIDGLAPEALGELLQTINAQSGTRTEISCPDASVILMAQ
jgi:hypothetical protein